MAEKLLTPHDVIVAKDAELKRLRDALETIWQHNCVCSPEIAIDPEEKQCASCIAGVTLGYINHSQMSD